MQNPLPSALTSTAHPAQSCSTSAGRPSPSGTEGTCGIQGPPAPPRAASPHPAPFPGFWWQTAPSSGASATAPWNCAGNPPQRKTNAELTRLQERLGRQLCFTSAVMVDLFAASIHASSKNAVPHPFTEWDPTCHNLTRLLTKILSWILEMFPSLHRSSSHARASHRTLPRGQEKAGSTEQDAE